MRTYSFGLLCAAAALSTIALPAAAAPITVKSMSDFAIKTSDLPVGCSKVEKNYDTDQVSITCDTDEHFLTGFIISGDLHCDPPKDGKSVCAVRKE